MNSDFILEFDYNKCNSFINSIKFNLIGENVYIFNRIIYFDSPEYIRFLQISDIYNLNPNSESQSIDSQQFLLTLRQEINNLELNLENLTEDIKKYKLWYNYINTSNIHIEEYFIMYNSRLRRNKGQQQFFLFI
jgi:hypothetical protein